MVTELKMNIRQRILNYTKILDGLARVQAKPTGRKQQKPQYESMSFAHNC